MLKSGFTKQVFIGGLIGLTGVAVAVAAGLYFIPGVDIQLPPPATFDLTIGEPYDEATVFLFDNVNIRVDTHTSPIPSWVEDRFIINFDNDTYYLYLDGRYVTEQKGESPALDRGRYAYSLWIPWEAVDPGRHTLTVVGKNVYWTGVSNAVHVNVVDLALVSGGDPYTPQSDDTLESVARKFGLSPIMLGAANPNITSFRDPISPDMPISIPKAFEPVDTPPQDDVQVGENGYFPGGDSEPPEKPINKVALWVELGLTKAGFIKDGPPVAPTLFRFKETCEVTLYIRDNSNNELGFYLYRLNPGSTVFNRIATFGPHSGDKFIEYTDKGLYGKYQYYASAFNAQGESVDSFMSAEFWDKGCLDPKMAAYKLNQVTLTPKVFADKAYCYYSYQEGEWSRLPEDPDAFVYPTSNGFDLSRPFSELTLFHQHPIKLDCWGWAGDSLEYLGAYEGAPKSEVTDRTMKWESGDGTIDASLSGFQLSPDIPLPKGLSDVIYIPPPYALKQTNLLDNCTSHSAGISPKEKEDCAEAVFLGYTILVWEWDPSCAGKPSCYSDINGFQVYGINEFGVSYLIATIPGRWQHAAVLLKHPEGERYYVRAHLSLSQSKRTNIVTVTEMSAGFKSVSLSPSAGTGQEITIDKYSSTPCGKTFEGLDWKDFLPTQLVGFTHNSFTTCLATSDHYHRSRIMFDLSGVDGSVSTARLSFSPEGTTVDGVVDATLLCAQSLNIVSAVSGDEATSFTPFLALPKYGVKGMSLTLDVTTAVKDWVTKGKPNFGFLITPQEGGYTKAEQSCLSQYGSFNLSINYFLK